MKDLKADKKSQFTLQAVTPEVVYYMLNKALKDMRIDRKGEVDLKDKKEGQEIELKDNKEEKEGKSTDVKEEVKEGKEINQNP